MEVFHGGVHNRGHGQAQGAAGDQGAWAGKGPNKHVGDEKCEQEEELRGFTKRQVYNKRDTMRAAGLVQVKV